MKHMKQISNTKITALYVLMALATFIEFLSVAGLPSDLTIIAKQTIFNTKKIQFIKHVVAFPTK